MSRPKKDLPEYKYHVSGQARVYTNGKYIYLGPYNSPESQAKYRRVVGHYIATGDAPDDDTDQLGDIALTVADVTAEAREWIKTHFANDPVQRHRFSGLCMLLEDECGDLPANDVGPRKLAELRDLFIASGNARKYVNSQTNNIVRIFRYALSREIIDAGVIVRLKSLESLRKGKTTAKERPPVQPANIEHVRATAATLSPTLRGNGSRPSRNRNAFFPRLKGTMDRLITWKAADFLLLAQTVLMAYSVEANCTKDKELTVISRSIDSTPQVSIIGASVGTCQYRASPPSGRSHTIPTV